MTTTTERSEAFPQLRSGPPTTVRTAVRRRLDTRWHCHRRSLCWLAGLLVVAGVVHAWGMYTFPRWVDDPGTYLSQAWAVQYEGRLSPYSYFYDHAPAGWVQLALWSMLTGGFDRYDSAMAFGNECMLIAKIMSVALLFWLGRRLGFSRPAAAAAGLLFALSPLALTYTRWTFLDNLVTPWIVLAFALAVSRKRTMLNAIGSGVAFAAACLTKETALILAPALLYALLQNSDRRNRSHVLIMAVGVSALLMSSYLVYALTKGEFLDGPGHNSLLETAKWQLVDRQDSGSALDPASVAGNTVTGWLANDPWLLLGGLAAVPLLLFVRRLRPVVLCLAVQVAAVLRGGYLPAMQVIDVLPWCALAVVGCVEALRGNPGLRIGPAWLLRRSDRRRAAMATIPAQAPPAPDAGLPMLLARRVVVGALVAAVAGLVVSQWAPKIAYMTSVAQPQELDQAEQWIADNVPRTDVLVVHDAIWTDLVHRYGFPADNVIMAYKIDADPAVHGRIDHLDYVVIPDWSYTAAQTGKYPTLVEARRHGVPVARFGAGADGVTVWQISTRWRP
jgi:Dolichyl-phosphate-mannose-protein mannosyltransferase